MKTVKNELTKKEVVDLLGVSGRTVERRLKPARQASGDHGLVSLYSRAAVIRLADELGRSLTAKPRVEGEVMPHLDATSRATSHPDAADGAQSLVASSSDGGAHLVVALVEALRAGVDSSPVWLTREQALGVSGLPVTWFDNAVREKRIPHVGEGRGRRYHREDVRRLAESLREI